MSRTLSSPGRRSRPPALFGPGDYLILQNEINGLDYIMEQAAQRGMVIAFNPFPMDESVFSLPFELVSLLVFNELEGAALAGCQDEEGILDILPGRWPDFRLLLTLGGRGHCRISTGSSALDSQHGGGPKRGSPSNAVRNVC